MSKKTLVIANLLILLLSCRSSSLRLSQDVADRQLASGDLNAALQSYEALAAQAEAPERKAALWFRAAEVAAALTQFEQALTYYQKAAHQVPFSELSQTASQRRAELFSELGNAEAMITEYAQLVKHFPKSQQVYLYRLRMSEGNLMLGHFHESLRELENLYQDPHLPEQMKETVFFNAAELYFLDGKFQQAMTAYSSFLQNFPHSTLAGEAHLKLASVLERMGQLGMAYQAAQPAAELYPNKSVVELRLKNLRENMTRPATKTLPPVQPKKTK